MSASDPTPASTASATAPIWKTTNRIGTRKLPTRSSTRWSSVPIPENTRIPESAGSRWSRVTVEVSSSGTRPASSKVVPVNER